MCSWPSGRQVLRETNKPNRRSNMLSLLPHPTFVPVALKTTSVIGMEAQTFFPDLSCHCRKNAAKVLCTPP